MNKCGTWYLSIKVINVVGTNKCITAPSELVYSLVLINGKYTRSKRGFCRLESTLHYGSFWTGLN